MGHYAKVNQNNKVEQVIVASADVIESFPEEEGIRWIKTSYNTRGGVHYEPNSNTPSSDQSKALRVNYAAVGSDYDPDRDAFIAMQPFASFVLDEQTLLWSPPQARPDDIYDPDGNMIGTWRWDEDAYNTDGEGWVIVGSYD